MRISNSHSGNSLNCQHNLNRSQRFGNALVRSGSLALKRKEFAKDFRPISDSCPCYTCQHYSRSVLHGLVNKEAAACHLLTVHNIAYQVSPQLQLQRLTLTLQLQLMTDARASIIDGTFPAFVQEFMKLQFHDKQYPEWVTNALSSVSIKLE